MGSYRIIFEISRLLQRNLWQGFEGDEALTHKLVPGAESIVLTSPADPAEDARRISLWLYQVRENEFVRTTRPTAVPGDSSVVRHPPLHIDLLYLITPFTGSPEGDQIVLGRILQSFQDNPILRLTTADDPDTSGELSVALFQGELPDIWRALRQPYRLSLCYVIRVVKLESTRPDMQESDPDLMRPRMR